MSRRRKVETYRIRLILQAVSDRPTFDPAYLGFVDPSVNEQ